MQEYIKNSLSPGNATTLIISNDEMEDITKIVKSLEDFGLYNTNNIQWWNRRHH